MKKMLTALLISALLMPGFGFANQASAHAPAAHSLVQAAFSPALELTDSELSLVEGEGVSTAVGGAILGGILGAITYGSTEKDRTFGGWFVAIAVAAAGGAASGLLVPVP